MLLDKGKDSPFPPKHNSYWNTSDHYLMGNVTPGDMRAIIQVCLTLSIQWTIHFSLKKPSESPQATCKVSIQLSAVRGTLLTSW